MDLDEFSNFSKFTHFPFFRQADSATTTVAMPNGNGSISRCQELLLQPLPASQHMVHLQHKVVTPRLGVPVELAQSLKMNL